MLPKVVHLDPKRVAGAVGAEAEEAQGNCRQADHPRDTEEGKEADPWCSCHVRKSVLLLLS